MSGFFGFNTALPERNQPAQTQNQGFGGFAGGRAANDQTAFGGLGGAGEEEDLAVYNWGDQTGSLMEDGDMANDETFGGMGDMSKSISSEVEDGPKLTFADNDFQFSSQPVSAPVSKPKVPQARGQVASTQSRYKPKVAHDPFAFSEDDFYSPRKPAGSESVRPRCRNGLNSH